LDHLAHVVEDRPSINDVLGQWSAFRRPASIFTGTISTDQFDSWMLFEPLREGIGGSVWEQINRTVHLQIDEDRSIGLTTTESKVIYP
jgi:hypothetical protein